jgi:hypothetical protein
MMQSTWGIYTRLAGHAFTHQIGRNKSTMKQRPFHAFPVDSAADFLVNIGISGILRSNTRSFSRNPVLHLQPRDASKFALVVGDDREA